MFGGVWNPTGVRLPSKRWVGTAADTSQSVTIGAALSMTLVPVAPTIIPEQFVSPAALVMTLVPVAPVIQVAQQVTIGAPLAMTLTPVAPQVNIGVTIASPLAMTMALLAPVVQAAQSVTIGSPLTMTLVPVAPVINNPQTVTIGSALAMAMAVLAPDVRMAVSPGTLAMTLVPLAPAVNVAAPPIAAGTSGIPNPRLVIVYYTNSSTTFGPVAVDGIIHDASEVGWSWYSRFPANAFFTLPQNSVHNTRLQPLLTHIAIWYVNEATAYRKLVFTGRLNEPDESGDDVVYTAWNYLAELSLSRTGYRTLYPSKLLGTEIASVEWGLAKNATKSILSHVATGTIENPLGTDGTTAIKTDNRFGVIDVPRLLLLFDLTEIGRANTVNNVVFGISREPPFTFTFLKNAGTARVNRRLSYPGTVSDFRFVPGYSNIRNDLATIGTTAGGGATEITAVDTPSRDTYGLRQDVFTIKTLSGVAGAATEQDAQTSITQRALKEAVQLSRTIELDIDQSWEPFDGWDLEDTYPVEIARGRTQVNSPYRIIGARGRMDAQGYHPSLVVQLPTV